MDTVYDPIADAVYEPVLGQVMADDVDIRGIGSASLIDKDLRSLLGEPVEGAYNVSYCGNGDLDACRDSLYAAIDGALAEAAVELGDDPSTWLSEGSRTTFVPGLIPDDFRFTSRPTFQQVLEFAPER
jgi:hypothetical protein